MNIRTSVVLLVVLALISGYVFFVQVGDTPAPTEEPPWFYSIDMSDINRITVTNLGEEAVFVLGEDQRWYFDEPEDMPVNMDRWGGITLLLSGPKASRLLLEEQPDDLAPYGLDTPPTRIEIDLKSGQSIPILLGDLSPDGVSIYAQQEGFPRIFTIVAGWEQIMTRLIYDPPYPQWYFNVNRSILTDIELEKGDQEVTLTVDGDAWYFGDEEKTAVGEDQLSAISAALGRPAFQRLVEFSAPDIAPYGLDEPTLTLFLRTRSMGEDGVNVTNEYLFTIGRPTDGGEGYYGQAYLPEGVPDVFSVDAGWVEALLAIVNDPSYLRTAVAAQETAG